MNPPPRYSLVWEEAGDVWILCGILDAGWREGGRGKSLAIGEESDDVCIINTLVAAGRGKCKKKKTQRVQMRLMGRAGDFRGVIICVPQGKGQKGRKRRKSDEALAESQSDWPRIGTTFNHTRAIPVRRNWRRLRNHGFSSMSNMEFEADLAFQSGPSRWGMGGTPSVSGGTEIFSKPNTGRIGESPSFS